MDNDENGVVLAEAGHYKLIMKPRGNVILLDAKELPIVDFSARDWTLISSPVLELIVAAYNVGKWAGQEMGYEEGRAEERTRRKQHKRREL
jgi:hypothetical protein